MPGLTTSATTAALASALSAALSPSPRAASAAGLAISLAAPLPLDLPGAGVGMPSPSAASGIPGMSRRLCTRIRRASRKVISTLLSDTTSETNPTPNLGWFTMTFSRYASRNS